MQASCIPRCLHCAVAASVYLKKSQHAKGVPGYQGRRCHFATVADFECAMSGCGPTCRGRGCTLTPAADWELGRDLPRIRKHSALSCHRSDQCLPTLRWQFADRSIRSKNDFVTAVTAANFVISSLARSDYFDQLM